MNNSIQLHIIKNVLLCIFLISTLSSSGQSHIIDEEIHGKTLHHIRKKTSVDSINFYINKLKQSNNQCRALFAMYFQANTFYNNNNYDECTKILDAIIFEIDTNPKPNTFIYSKHMVGKTYEETINIIKLNVYRRFFYMKSNEKHHKEVYDYLLLMQDIVDNLPRKDTYYIKNKISTTYSLAKLKKALGDFEESIKILKALDKKIETVEVSEEDVWYKNFLIQKRNVNSEIASNYKRLGIENPLELDKINTHKFYDTADVYIEKAYNLSKQIDSNSIGNKSGYYQAKAELSLFKEDYANCIELANTAKGFYNPNKFTRGIYSLKANSFSKLKQADSAVYFADKIINNKKDKIKRGYSGLYNILAENYFSLGKLDSAYKYSQLSIKTLKSQNIDKEKTSLYLKNDEISNAISLNKSIEKKKHLLENKFIYTALILGLIIIAISVYSIFKRKKLKQKIVESKEELDSLHKTNSIKNQTILIDDKTINRILGDLTNIEASTIYLNKDFSLNVLAKLLNTNTSYLSRIINEHKEKTFKQYLIDLRITTLIKNLDENPIMRKYSIEALAESIGYTNASSFTRLFKNHVGVSPSKYLKENYSDLK